MPRFIVLEGGDGAGKTTQARLLAERLRADGHEVCELREPGGTRAGEELRRIVLDAALPLDARAEALVFAASRAQGMAEIVEPALARGAIVVADRSVISSLVYQGAVRELGVEQVRSINAFALRGLEPDLVLLLDVRLEDARARRGEAAGDRFEDESDEFARRVLEAYREICADAVVIDAHGDPEHVAEQVWEAVHAR